MFHMVVIRVVLVSFVRFSFYIWAVFPSFSVKTHVPSSILFCFFLIYFHAAFILTSAGGVPCSSLRPFSVLYRLSMCRRVCAPVMVSVKRCFYPRFFFCLILNQLSRVLSRLQSFFFSLFSSLFFFLLWALEASSCIVKREAATRIRLRMKAENQTEKQTKEERGKKKTKGKPALL